MSPVRRWWDVFSPPLCLCSAAPPEPGGERGAPAGAVPLGGLGSLFPTGSAGRKALGLGPPQTSGSAGGLEAVGLRIGKERFHQPPKRRWERLRGMARVEAPGLLRLPEGTGGNGARGTYLKNKLKKKVIWITKLRFNARVNRTVPLSCCA